MWVWVHMCVAGGQRITFFSDFSDRIFHWPGAPQIGWLDRHGVLALGRHRLVGEASLCTARVPAQPLQRNPVWAGAANKLQGSTGLPS